MFEITYFVAGTRNHYRMLVKAKTLTDAKEYIRKKFAGKDVMFFSCAEITFDKHNCYFL